MICVPLSLSLSLSLSVCLSLSLSLCVCALDRRTHSVFNNDSWLYQFHFNLWGLLVWHSVLEGKTHTLIQDCTTTPRLQENMTLCWRRQLNVDYTASSIMTPPPPHLPTWEFGHLPVCEPSLSFFQCRCDANPLEEFINTSAWYYLDPLWQRTDMMGVMSTHARGSEESGAFSLKVHSSPFEIPDKLSQSAHHGILYYCIWFNIAYFDN